jgi:hypothetical protein
MLNYTYKRLPKLCKIFLKIVFLEIILLNVRKSAIDYTKLFAYLCKRLFWFQPYSLISFSVVMLFITLTIT